MAHRAYAWSERCEEVARAVDEVTIGARLRTLRRWRGKSQTELAGLAGLSPSFLSMVETGKRPLDRRSHIACGSILVGRMTVAGEEENH